MSVSPSIEIKGKDPHLNARPQLEYAAQFFRSTTQRVPLATLQVMGTSGFYTGQIADALERLGVPRHKIGVLTVGNPFSAASPINFYQSSPSFSFNLNVEHSASVYVDYGNATPKKRFSVEFKQDGKDFPVEVDFEVAPDGSMLTEVEAEWVAPLGKVIVEGSRNTSFGGLKFATKIVGLAGFEQKTVDKIEVELKGKLKPALSIFLKTRGIKDLKVTFYGEVGLKYAEDKVKGFGGGGVLFEIPFDITDIGK